MMEHNCGTSSDVCYRCNGGVDNQLAFIYNNLNIASVTLNPIDFGPLNSVFPNVHVAHNIISNELAIDARDFLNKIPINHNINMLNNTDNKPRTCITDFIENQNYIDTYLSTISKLKSINKYPKPNPESWIWEHYGHGIYRATPTTLNAFIDSPIQKLITELESKFCSTAYFPDIDFSQYKKATWVLQKTKRGDMIGPHTDENRERKFAFIYYLTDDNWDYKNDGGDFVVSDQRYEK